MEIKIAKRADKRIIITREPNGNVATEAILFKNILILDSKSK